VTVGAGSGAFSRGGGVSSRKSFNSGGVSGTRSCAVADAPKAAASKAAAKTLRWTRVTRALIMLVERDWLVERMVNDGGE
jgi:hypothetical protein